MPKIHCPATADAIRRVRDAESMRD
jgi:hypothetical protein